MVSGYNCKEGTQCCDDRRASTQRPRPRPTPPPTTTRRPIQQFLPTTTQAPDYREECPGSCIVSLLSFTCFSKSIFNVILIFLICLNLKAIYCHLLQLGNAEMTDLFKCKKSGTTCCAPKSRIHEVQGMLLHRNDSFPMFVNPQQQQQIPQYLANNNYATNYQPIPPNSYAPLLPNSYQPVPPQVALPNNYQVPSLPPQTNYIQQQQQQQQAISSPVVANNYPVPQPIPPQNYPVPVPSNNVYPQNVIVQNPNVNSAPAYSTSSKNVLNKILSLYYSLYNNNNNKCFFQFQHSQQQRQQHQQHHAHQFIRNMYVVSKVPVEHPKKNSWNASHKAQRCKTIESVLNVKS